MITIRSASAADLPAFFDYLDDHLSDNGVGGTPLFQPMARAQSAFPPDKRAAFERGMVVPLVGPGWRRLWLAVDGDAIRGHIDLRVRPESAARHRVLLGMGVHRDVRRAGLGGQLLQTAMDWARAIDALAWIDLEVLSVNEPARALYRRAGFVQTGEIADMFRVDGERLGYCYMSLPLRQQ